MSATLMKQTSLKPCIVKSTEIRWKENLQQIKSLSKRGYRVTIDATGKIASSTLVEEYNQLFSVKIVSINCMDVFLNHISGRKTGWCQMSEQSVLGKKLNIIEDGYSIVKRLF